MKKNVAFLIVALAFAPIAAAGNPGPDTPKAFTPNHLFVTSYGTDEVLEFDPDGNLVGSLDAGGGLSGPEGLAFGPNGDLFVACSVSSRVVQIDPSGAVIHNFTHADLTGAMGITFGPDGRLVVTSLGPRKIVEFELTGAHLRTIDISALGGAPHQLCIGPDGHYLVNAYSSNVLRELDPSGTSLRELGAGILAGPTGVCFGPAGILAVASLLADEVRFFTPAGASLTTFSDAGLDNPRQMIGGPDFTYWVASDGTNRAVSFLGNSKRREIGAGSGLSGPGGVAFAPFRFKAKVKGTTSGGSGLTKISQKAIVSIAPGSNTLMVEFRDPAVGIGYSFLFNTDYFVGHGMEGTTAADQEARLFVGAEVRSPALSNGDGHLALRVKGRVDANDFFRVKKAAGDLSRSDGYTILKAKIKTSKLLE